MTFFIDDPDGLLTNSLGLSPNPQTSQRLVANVMNAFLSNLNSTENTGGDFSQASGMFSGVMNQFFNGNAAATTGQPSQTTEDASSNINFRRRRRSDSQLSDSEVQQRRRSPRFMPDVQIPENTASIPPSNSTSTETNMPRRPASPRSMTNNFSDLISFASEIFGSIFRSGANPTNSTGNQNTTSGQSEGTTTASPDMPQSDETSFRASAQGHRFQFIPINIFPNGLFGDYAMNDRSFDDIITHLLEQEALRHRPPSASEETIEKLLRSEISAEHLEKHVDAECIICKDGFKLNDPIIHLPCKHIFHPDCLIPWLKLNGTCPTCRFSLVVGKPAPEAETPQVPQPIVSPESDVL